MGNLLISYTFCKIAQIEALIKDKTSASLSRGEIRPPETSFPLENAWAGKKKELGFQI